jgi:hypothetical protein
VVEPVDVLRGAHAKISFTHHRDLSQDAIEQRCLVGSRRGRQSTLQASCLDHLVEQCMSWSRGGRRQSPLPSSASRSRTPTHLQGGPLAVVFKVFGGCDALSSASFRSDSDRTRDRWQYCVGRAGGTGWWPFREDGCSHGSRRVAIGRRCGPTMGCPASKGRSHRYPGTTVITFLTARQSSISEQAKGGLSWEGDVRG